jgi:threonine dehydrogenase-like Zn-dependent dehydrogenase
MSILPGTQLVRLSDDISAEELTLFEPLSNMVAWLTKVNLQAGQTIVIQGPGHMGLTCAAYAKSLGATVIVTGTDEDALRLEVAREVGADHAIDVTVDDPVEVVQDLTGGFGASVAVDLASAPSTPSLCFDLVHHLGQVIWAGLKDRAAVPVITDKVVMKSLTIHGGAGGTPESVAEACRILNEGGFPTGPLLGEVVGLEDIDRAMEILLRTAGTDAVRAVLKHAPQSS